MERSEIMEIRKLFKTYSESGCPTNGFCGGMITPDSEVIGCFGRKDFHSEEDATKKRIFTFASKAISNNAVTLEINEKTKDLLSKILATKVSNKELHEELCNRIADSIKEAEKENAYAVTLLGYTYDPPCKTSDHKKVMDGVTDIIYRFMVCMISPVTTPVPSLGYFTKEARMGMNPPIHSIGDPVCAFVYPDFTGREPDDNAVLYLGTDKLDIAGQLFESNTPKKQDKTEEKKTPSAPQPKPQIPSLDTGTLSSEVRKNDTVKETNETPEAFSETIVPELPAPKKKKVRITGDTKALKKQMIDGVMCLVIPVSDADIG